MGSGIRQGCSLSPLLWSLITGLIYRQFQTALALQNLPEGTTTLFADDVFGSWLFQTPTTFRKAIRAVGVLIDVIQKAGLKLSMDKTVILLLAQGTSAPSILSGIRRFIDKIPHLLVPIGRVRSWCKNTSTWGRSSAIITLSLPTCAIGFLSCGVLIGGYNIFSEVEL